VESSRAQAPKEPTTAEKIAEAEKGERAGRAKAQTLDDVARLRENAPKAESPPTNADRKMWGEYVDYHRKRVDAIEADIKAGRTPRDPGPLSWEAYSTFRTRFKLAMEFQDKQTAAVKEARPDLTVQGEVRVESVAKEKINAERQKQLDAGEKGTKPAPDRADQLGLDRKQLEDYQTGKRIEPPEGESFSNKRRNPKEYRTADDLVKQAEADGAEAISKYSGDVKIESAKFDTRPDNTPAPRSLVGAKVPVKKVWVIYDGTLIVDPALRARIRAAVDTGSNGRATAVFSDEVAGVIGGR
jgi:hypothetical protein